MANENGEWPLPEGWSRVQLSELANSPREQIVDGPFGSNLKASEYVDSGVPIIRLQNIDRGQFVEKNIKYITPKKADSLSRHSFREGDIVITKLGDPLGKACIVPNGFGSGIVVADVVRARLDDERVSRAYVVYAINSPIVIEQLKRRTKGTTRPRVNLGHIREIEIPIAPLPEQERIVAEIEKQFTRLDTAVAALERVQAGLARYKASVLKAAVEGRLVPQDPAAEPAELLLQRILAERRAKWEEAELEKMAARGQTPQNDKWKAKYKEPQGPDTADLPELPVGWVWATVEQLTSLVTSGSRGWASYYADEGPVFIRAQDINSDRLELESVAHVKPPQSAEGKRTSVNQHDLLITITGANVTKTAVVDRDLEEAYVSQHVALTRPVETEISRYLYFWIIAPAHGRRLLTKLAYGAGKPGLNLTNVRELPVALPSLTEQYRLIGELEKHLSTIEASEVILGRALIRSVRLRQAILEKAFRGELV